MYLIEPLPRQKALAERFNGKAVKLDNFVDYAKDADILITSTGAPHYIITEREAKKITSLRKGEPIVMIDIGGTNAISILP